MTTQKPVAVVTGANTGIGRCTAEGLALRGYRVVLACRDEGRGAAALSEMQERCGDAARGMVLGLIDLASFASVARFAEWLRGQVDGVNILVCNAGVNQASVPHEAGKQLTSDGIDVLYQANFLSHLLLALLTMPLLQARSGRVVSVTSVMHRHASAEELDLVLKVARSME